MNLGQVMQQDYGPESGRSANAGQPSSWRVTSLASVDNGDHPSIAIVREKAGERFACSEFLA